MSEPPTRLVSAATLAYRALGATVAIAGMEAFAQGIMEPLFRVPFVTSIVLVMALPRSDPARWTSVIGGHMLSCICGYAVLWTFGSGPAAAAIAVGLATLAMSGARCLHPPAGINAFLISQNALPIAWLVSPVAVGAVLLVAYSYLWWEGEKRFFAVPTNAGST